MGYSELIVSVSWHGTWPTENGESCSVHIRQEAELERVLMRLRGGSRTGPPCHPFHAGSNPARDNVLGLVHNTWHNCSQSISWELSNGIGHESGFALDGEDGWWKKRVG